MDHRHFDILFAAAVYNIFCDMVQGLHVRHMQINHNQICQLVL